MCQIPQFSISSRAMKPSVDNLTGKTKLSKLELIQQPLVVPSQYSRYTVTFSVHTLYNVGVVHSMEKFGDLTA